MTEHKKRFQPQRLLSVTEQKEFSYLNLYPSLGSNRAQKASSAPAVVLWRARNMQVPVSWHLPEEVALDPQGSWSCSARSRWSFAPWSTKQEVTEHKEKDTKIKTAHVCDRDGRSFIARCSTKAAKVCTVWFEPIPAHPTHTNFNVSQSANVKQAAIGQTYVVWLFNGAFSVLVLCWLRATFCRIPSSKACSLPAVLGLPNWFWFLTQLQFRKRLCPQCGHRNCCRQRKVINNV